MAYPKHPPSCCILQSNIKPPIGEPGTVMDNTTGASCKSVVIGYATREEFIAQPMDNYPRLGDGAILVPHATGPYYLRVSFD